MVQGARNLSRQFIVKTVNQISNVIGDVSNVQSLSPPEAGIENVLQILNHGHHDFILGQRTVVQMIDTIFAGVGLDDRSSSAGEVALLVVRRMP